MRTGLKIKGAAARQKQHASFGLCRCTRLFLLTEAVVSLCPNPSI